MAVALRPWIVALALHLGLVLSVWSAPERSLMPPDSMEYLTIASNLTAGHGFSQAAAPPYAPDLRRTPVYPAALAAIGRMTQPSVRSAVVLNSGLGLVTIALVCLTMAHRWGARVGAGAGWLLATDPVTLTYHHLVLSETLFALLLLVAVWLIGGIGWPRWPRAVAAGVTVGVAALCRPIGLYLAPALLPALAVHARRQPWRRALGSYVLVNMACGAVLGVWVLRNAVVFGVPVLTSQGSVNLYFHRAAYVQATLESVDVDIVRDRWTREMNARGAGWSDAEKAAWLSQNGRAIVAAHPVIYLRVYLAALAKMFAPEQDDIFRLLGLSPGSGWAHVVLAAAWLQLAGFYGCVAVGAARMYRVMPAQALLAVAATVVAYFIVISGPEVYARFRMPLMPVLALVGGFAFTPK